MCYKISKTKLAKLFYFTMFIQLKNSLKQISVLLIHKSIKEKLTLLFLKEVCKHLCRLIDLPISATFLIVCLKAQMIESRTSLN